MKSRVVVEPDGVTFRFYVSFDDGPFVFRGRFRAPLGSTEDQMRAIAVEILGA